MRENKALILARAWLSVLRWGCWGCVAFTNSSSLREENRRLVKVSMPRVGPNVPGCQALAACGLCPVFSASYFSRLLDFFV